jgi:hypothetical protein
MTATIEYQGRPVSFIPEAGILIERGGEPVMPASNERIVVCAWPDCDPDKKLTGKLREAGYLISHGLCNSCKSKVFK